MVVEKSVYPRVVAPVASKMSNMFWAVRAVPHFRGTSLQLDPGGSAVMVFGIGNYRTWLDITTVSPNDTVIDLYLCSLI